MRHYARGTDRPAWNIPSAILLQRYPGTTEIGLREAHAYAYGGCLIQDLGYYPFGETLLAISRITCGVATLFSPFCETLRA